MNSRRSGLRSRGKVQDFEKLHSAALKSGKLFEDDEFPAVNGSVSKSTKTPIKWLRPHEIVDSPKFITDGATRFDVQQGRLADCWLLAAVSNLTLNKSLLDRVVPPEQSFEDKYAGIFRFRFWQFGRWEEVVVDDRLPTKNGALMFLKSPNNEEFWTPLLEKAYAKLHGCYEALEIGYFSEAVVDMTGGVNELFAVRRIPRNFHKVMMKASRLGSFMGCSIKADPNATEAVLQNGLVCGHIYSITKICEANIKTSNKSGKTWMVRVRNPWGKQEWKGDFSDKCKLWGDVSEEVRKEMELTSEVDGEFWMTYDDFITNFEYLEISSLGPDSFDEIYSNIMEEEVTETQHWETSMFDGSWVRGVTAGGDPTCKDTFHHNPQYFLTLKEADDADDDGKCTIIVSLMQKHRRAMRKGNLSIGYFIYHLPDSTDTTNPLDQRFYDANHPVAGSRDCFNYREVTCRFKLLPGTYIIVPTTLKANEEGDFIVRVFSEKANDMAEPGVQAIALTIHEPVKFVGDARIMKVIEAAFAEIVGDLQSITYKQLQKILVCIGEKLMLAQSGGFGLVTVRLLMAVMGVDNSDVIPIDKIMDLLNKICKWIKAFNLHKMHRSANLSPFGLQKAVKDAGFSANNKLLKCLMHRYGDENGEISLDDFVTMSIRLERCTDILCARGTDKSGDVTDNELVEEFMYS